MIWADREAKRLKERNFSQEWVDDMKTPSGRIHVGSLRGVIIHDMIYKALKELKVNVHFSYVFNDMDPMDALPSYLDKNQWERYMGYPLYKIPSPQKKYSSFASYFAYEFIEVFNNLNAYPQIIWSSELYRLGKMDKIVKTFLNNVDKVRKIYKDVAKAEKPENWYPYHPICQKCGKIGTTNVYKWDGKYVYYRCEYHLVDWANGCGFEGKVEPVGENGKLPWKLDWPGHWAAIGITVESSGKDHMSAGGSYDVASHLAKDVLNYPPPDALGGYEWFTVKGKKMSSSKGVGSSAKEISEILPAEVLRFLIVRTPIKSHIDFHPSQETIFKLFDDYDRYLNAYFDKIEGKIPQGKKGEVITDFSRIIEFSKVKSLPKKRLYLPRFKTIVNLIAHKKNNLINFFNNLKKDKLNDEEKKILEERVFYAKIYLERYQEKKEEKKIISSFLLKEKQKEFLKNLKDNLKKIKNEDEIINIFNQTIKESEITPKEAFSAFYYVLTGKIFGPKAVDLIKSIGLNQVIEKLNQI